MPRRPASSSAALPIAHVALRILIVLNWLMGGAIVILLVVSPNEQWILSAFKLSPSPEAERLVMGLLSILLMTFHLSDDQRSGLEPQEERSERRGAGHGEFDRSHRFRD